MWCIHYLISNSLKKPAEKTKSTLPARIGEWKVGDELEYKEYTGQTVRLHGQFHGIIGDSVIISTNGVLNSVYSYLVIQNISLTKRDFKVHQDKLKEQARLYREASGEVIQEFREEATPGLIALTKAGLVCRVGTDSDGLYVELLTKPIRSIAEKVSVNIDGNIHSMYYSDRIDWHTTKKLQEWLNGRL